MKASLLWPGVVNAEQRRNHFVSWEVCCEPNNGGELELGNLVSEHENIALVVK